MYPCESNNPNKFKINRILPVFWTKIKSLKTNYEETKNNMYFINMSEILNTDWIKEIPNFHVTKQIPNIDKYLNDIILKKINKPLIIDEFLGDIIYLTWLTILTLTIGFIIYKIYLVIIKTEFITSPLPIPPRNE